MSDEIEENEYDREKTLAVLTGLICMCVSFGGTALGSYHAIVVIGVLAGILATACYIIADLVVYWAARIDYKESGNAMEWTSWAVKYILSFYLLFSGGCVAYVLFSESGVQSNRTATTDRAQQQFQQCVKSGAKQSVCQKQYDGVLKTESSQNESIASKGKTEWVEKFIQFPLFNYIPGILGLIGAVVLTFVAKLTANKKRKTKPVETPQPTQAKLKLQTAQAPFRATSLHKVENGNGFGLSLSPSGYGVSIRFHERSNQTAHVIRVPQAVADSEALESLDYKRLAVWSLRRLEAEGKNTKPVYKRIEATI